MGGPVATRKGRAVAQRYGDMWADHSFPVRTFFHDVVLDERTGYSEDAVCRMLMLRRFGPKAEDQ